MLSFLYPYRTTGKTIALTRQAFVVKVMPLLFNMLSRLVITFLPRSKRLLISLLQPPSAVILEPQKIKSATVSPSICCEVMGLDAVILLHLKGQLLLTCSQMLPYWSAGPFSTGSIIITAAFRN